MKRIVNAEKTWTNLCSEETLFFGIFKMLEVYLMKTARAAMKKATLRRMVKMVNYSLTV